MNKIIFAFDFYGSGNIGDDLMLAGFLAGLKTIKYTATITAPSRPNIESQRKRFPEINWITPKDFQQLGRTKNADGILAGVGDTPLQILCGREWFLDYLLNLGHLFAGMRRVMVNVGAESEIISHAEEFGVAVQQFERISTRDTFSSTVVKSLPGIASSRVTSGGDLATLALSQIDFKSQGKKRRGQSLILAADTLSELDLAAVGEFLKMTRSPIDFIANDVSPYDCMEQRVYERLAPKKMFGIFRKGRLNVPDYNTSDWRELVRCFETPEVVVSSRYHGLLCAAYSGCRIGAIARSSKVAELAKELMIPFCLPPLTPSKIHEVFKNACPCDPTYLSKMEEMALNGISHCFANNDH